MSKAYKNNGQVSVINEDNNAIRFYASQEEQGLERLMENMSRSATEKFYSLMAMMKIGTMMKKAIIHHKV